MIPIPVRFFVRLALFFSCLATIASSGTAWSAWPHDPFSGVPLVSPPLSNQGEMVAVADGAGGAYLAFRDDRGGGQDIYVQRLSANGNVAPGWPASGLAACVAPGNKNALTAIPDGGGGVYLAWEDPRSGTRDIYAQHVLPAGTIAPGWPASGKQISTNPKDDESPVLASDGARGFFVAWVLLYTPAVDHDIYAAHYDSTGTVMWNFGLATPAAIQDNPAIASDGSGGMLVVYVDNQSGNYNIMVSRVNGAGVVLYGPTSACSDPSDQLFPAIAGDGAGGAWVVWRDFRNPSIDIYGNFLGPTGFGNYYPLDGAPICNAPLDQGRPQIVGDNDHGAYVAWTDPRSGDDDVYLQHLAPGVGNYPGWPANGLVVSAVAGSTQDLDCLAVDNRGGAVLTWIDHRSGAYDVYAARVTSTGSSPAGWAANGNAVSLNPQNFNSWACADTNGNAIVGWIALIGGKYLAYAQRVDSFGQLGDPSPSILKVKDVLADQGGQVRLDWSASYLDANPTYGVSSYWIWRQAPAAQVQMALARGARLVDAAGLGALAPSDAARGPLYLKTEGYNWEYVASQAASAFPTYSYVAQTTTDSTGGHNYYTPFMVQARGSGGMFWSSAPDSGYSVDNLPPVAPAPFLGVYLAGATHLHWGANTEPDLFGYRLYRGASSGFTPDLGSLVSAQPDTGYVDVGPAGSWYKLSAIDVHGNESVFAVLGPNNTVDAPRALPAELALAGPRPNPATGEGLAFELALPRPAQVSLAVFDAEGRLVRQLARGTMPAGENKVPWDLRDTGGRAVANGVYFALFEAEGRSFRQRLAVLR